MQFTEKKFAQLRKEQKAKKCADILRDLLKEPGAFWKETLKHYNELCRWQDRSDLCLNPNTLKITPLLNAYNEWRSLTGLGPEDSVLSIPLETDRDHPQGASISWKVWLHNLRSGHNVGAILRTIDCMGWEGAFISGYTPNAHHASVKSSAMGSEQWISVENWTTEQILEELKKQRIPLYALELTEDAQILGNFDWPKSGVLILGNEEMGVSPDLISKCQGTIKIPLYGRKGSLNVSNAFAIAAFDARRCLG